MKAFVWTGTLWVHVSCCAGQGYNSGWPSGAEDPRRHTARHDAADGQARCASPGVQPSSARQPQREWWAGVGGSRGVDGNAYFLQKLRPVQASITKSSGCTECTEWSRVTAGMRSCTCTGASTAQPDKAGPQGGCCVGCCDCGVSLPQLGCSLVHVIVRLVVKLVRLIVKLVCQTRGQCTDGMRAAGVLQVHVRVSIPKGISGEERELVQQLKELQSKTRVGPFTF